MKHQHAAALFPRNVARYDSRPVEPVDPGLRAALAWRKDRAARIANAQRAVPTGQMVGSRYQGGSSFAARGR